jgi:hypothetical protein
MTGLGDAAGVPQPALHDAVAGAAGREVAKPVAPSCLRAATGAELLHESIKNLGEMPHTSALSC